MEIFFTQSMFWGPFRIVLFVLFCYLISVLIVKNSSSKSDLDFFAVNYSLGISYTLLVILILTQINGYDLVTLFIVLFLASVLILLDINWKLPIMPQLKTIKRRFTIYTIKTYENDNDFISKKNIRKTNTLLKKDLKRKRNKKWQIGLAIFIASVCFISRYYFFNFDTYILSESWYEDLSNVIDLTAQNWFFHDQTMMGQFAVINFYSKITGISDAIALTSFAIIESSLLAVILFWFVNKITNSSFLAGFVTATSFIVFHAFLPININLVTQPKSAFFAATIALPFIAFVFMPNLLARKVQTFTFLLFILALAIGFVNLFVFVIILPIIILLAFFFNWQAFKKQNIGLLKAYIFALIILFTIHLIASITKDYNLITFIKSNLISYKNYTFSPQLVVPFDELIVYYQWLVLGFLALSTFLWKVKQMNQKNVTIILTFLLIVFNLIFFRNSFIDVDLLNQVLVIFIPVFFGIATFIILRLVSLVKSSFKLPFLARTISTLVIITGLVIYLENGSLTNYPKQNPLREQILSVYDKMYRDLLPFSYAVVNNDSNFRMGENSHYFINYTFFTSNYLDLDENYQLHKKDEQYLNEHPELIVPQSVFVFVYSESVNNNLKNKIDTSKQQNTLNTITTLKNRGRRVELFYNQPQLKVYQIINEEKSTKINDLLF